MWTTIKHYIMLLKDTFTAWQDDHAPRLGAALSFYSIFSLGPLLLLLLAAAGFIFGAEAAQGKIIAQIDDMVGRDGAAAVQEMIKASSNHKEGLWATLIGVVTLLVGASGLFGQLQDALNTIWNVQPPAKNSAKDSKGAAKTSFFKSAFNFIRHRFLSFTMVLGTGFLLLVSLVLSAVLSALSTSVGNYASDILPVGLMNTGLPLWESLNFIISFGVTTLLFALIFKILPEVKIAWRNVWVGAALTSALFAIGKFAIGFYLGHSAVGSTFGAAGSVVVLLVWIYYSVQILLFGAEFTKVYTLSKTKNKPLFVV